MIENARRQLILVAVVLSAAVYALTVYQPNLGLDLTGGTQLIYDVDVAQAKEEKLVAADADPDALMQETADIIYERIDPSGTIDATVARRGSEGLLVELPKLTEAEATAVEQRIETLGRLEFRMLVTGNSAKDGVEFDMEGEKARLKAWLDKDDNRAKVAAEPLAINIYNNLAGDEGSISPHLAWYPHVISADTRNPERWNSAPGKDFVNVYTDEEYAAGPKSETASLVTLAPVNMKEVHFTGQQLDASKVFAGKDPSTGKPAVFYGLQAKFVDAYADWSEKYIGDSSAIILNGLVESWPHFVSRIPGDGIITMGRGGMTQATELAKVLKTGSLQIRPERQSRIEIGPTLGAMAIERGQWSMVLGAALVFLFILWYYRTAGVVAVVGLILNIVFLLGAMIGIRATLTLPGIAGLVLTVGMAVDANILIYERVREELARGKALLQAVRAGFERAMLTILDSNITTFLAGVVLYNVGVGPIRGFAVTLMVGILTSVFTAFFVSRLIYHWLLTTERLSKFQTGNWFTNINVNFLKYARQAFIVSWVIIGFGLVNLFTTPREVSLGLDFTGGANLRVALKQPMTKLAIRERLLANAEFKGNFPDPQINTVGELDANGASREFAIKLKLTPQYAEQIKNERAAAKAAKETYTPPYVAQFEAILGNLLVDHAYDRALVEDDPFSKQALGTLVLHFTEPVKAADLQAQLARHFRLPEEGAVRVLDGSDAGRDIEITVEVPKETKADNLFALMIGPLNGLKRADGEKIPLSTPFPEASEIGGRMVGELQTSAIGSLVLAMGLIVIYVRIRFHEFKYGIAAVVALVHDVLITLGIVVAANHFGIVTAEIDMAMIAALLTVVGYSINDTIVIFDRIRENVSDAERLGSNEPFADLANQAINQTFSRTVLTTLTTLVVVLSQFVVNYGSGSALEGFSFALLVGIFTGSYSTVFIATPVVLWVRQRAERSARAAAEGPPAAA